MTLDLDQFLEAIDDREVALVIHHAMSPVRNQPSAFTVRAVASKLFS